VVALALSCESFEEFEGQAAMRGLKFSSPMGWYEEDEFSLLTHRGGESCAPCGSGMGQWRDVAVGNIRVTAFHSLMGQIDREGFEQVYHEYAVDFEEEEPEQEELLLSMITEGECVCVHSGFF